MRPRWSAGRRGPALLAGLMLAGLMLAGLMLAQASVVGPAARKGAIRATRAT